MRRLPLVMVCAALLLVITASSMAAAPVKLTVWAMGAEAQKIGDMTAKFEKANPGIRVTVQAIPWSAAHDKIITAVAGGTGPDVAQMGTTWMAEFGSIGVFEDLSRYISKSKTVEKGQFFSGSWGTCVVAGKVYGIPWYVDTRALFYRTDLLAAKGFKQAPRTWEELRAAAAALAGDDLFGMALSTNNYQEFMPFVWQNGGRILDEKGRPAVTEPEFIEALDFYAKLFHDKLAPIDSGGTDLFQEFAKGTMPMYFSGPWMINLTNEQVPEIAGKWSVAVCPKKKTRTSFVGGCNLVVFRDSRNKDAAWRFIEFMSDAGNQLEWFGVSGCLPAAKVSWDAAELAGNPMMAVFREQLDDAQAPENVPQWAQIEAAIQRRVQEACYGKKTAAEAARALEADIRAIR
ncbi:MAG: sugar ABC transporter substrate-binding protein [Bacillota bacterium]|jgi:multiple sugar transport system substrate-binding protein